MLSGWFIVSLVITRSWFIDAIPLNVTSLSCTANEKYCANNRCFLESKRNGIKLANFHCTFPVPITYPTLKFRLLKSDGKIYKHEIFNAVEDICKLYANTGRSNILTRMIVRFKQSSEYPTECPLTNVITLSNYPLDLSFFPSVAPSGKYLQIMNIFKSDTNEMVVNATVKFEIKYGFNGKS